MRKKINKIIAFAVCISVCSSLTVFAEPKEIIGHKALKKWDYHKTNFDKNGKERQAPGAVQFDTENEGKEIIDARIPELISNDTLYGGDINISFNASTSEHKQWQANICRITKIDTESGNPNLEMDIKFKVEDGKIILYSNSKPIDYNDKHTIKIYSTGYEAIKHTMHIVEKAPEIRINPDFKPTINQDILFELVNFNYRIKNPIYEVIVDGKTLKGDCEDYHVISNLVRLERKGRILTAGKHTLVIKAYGYQDAVLEFMVSQGNGEGNPVDKHVDKHVNKVSFPTRMKSNASTQNVDAVSTASVSKGGGTGTGTGTVDGVSSASASGSLDMNANIIFNFDLISNACILKNLKMETENSKKVLEIWESVAKDAAISKETGRIVSWSAFTNEVEKAKVKGEHVTFEDYIKNPDAEDYKNRPYNVKYVLEDGLYGQVQSYNQISMKGTPQLQTKSSNKLGEDIIIAFNVESSWEDNINAVKVGNTILRENEYKIEAGKITIKGYNFTAGENNVVILSEGYKSTDINVLVESETITLSVLGDANIGKNVEIKGITKEYIGRLEGITLNGELLLSESAAGESGQYKVQMDKIILDKKLFSNTTQQTLIVKAYGYSDKMIQFTMKKSEVVVVDPANDVVPALKVKETVEGENSIITFDNDNPKWRNAVKKIYVANRPLPIDESSYSIEKGKITILGRCFSIGENKIVIKAEGYDDVSVMQLIKEKPIVEIQKAFPKFKQENTAQVGKVLVLKMIKEDNKDYINWNNNITIKVNDKVLKTYEYEINKGQIIIKNSIFIKDGTSTIEIIPENFEKVILEVQVEKADLKQAQIINPEPIFVTDDFIIQNSEWTNAISKIAVVSSKGESKELVREIDYYYDRSNSRFIIAGSVFTNADLVDIVISSEGYVDSKIKLTVKSRMAVPDEVRIEGDKTISTGQVVKINLPLGYLGSGKEYNVKEVYINDKKLSESEVQINSVSVTIKKDYFNKSGKYNITLKALKYEDGTFEITVGGNDLANPGVLNNSPALTSDITDNVLGGDIEVTFVENQAWRNEIEKINVNGTAIEFSKIKKESGKITFYSSLFSKDGTYSIEILSNGFKPVTVDQVIKDKQPVITTNSADKTVNEKILTLTAKPVAQLVKLVNDNVKISDEVKITVKEGFFGDYHKKISQVIIDNGVLDNSKYTLPGEYSFNETELKIKGNVFTEARDYTIILKANGYEDKTLTVTIGQSQL